MAGDWGKQYSDDWSDISEFVKEHDNYTCQNCGTRGRKYGPAELHAHHIKQKSEGGSDDPSNLRTLCWKCHNDVHDHYIRPMTDKARTVNPPSSTANSQSSQSWKTNDGPADESLQRIAEKTYNSSITSDLTQNSKTSSVSVTNKDRTKNNVNTSEYEIGKTSSEQSSVSIAYLVGISLFVLSFLIDIPYLFIISLIVSFFAYSFDLSKNK